MKPIAIFVLVAAVSVAAIATSAKNVTAPGNTDARMVAGVAGPRAAAETSQRRMTTQAGNKGEQPSETEKAKIKPEPPLQDLH